MAHIKTIRPPYLKAGDIVGIVAPSRKITEPELLPAIRILEKWGLKVKTGANIYSAFNQFAGNDKARTSDFQSMLDDSSVKAIFCARGGYGAARIIDSLDFSCLVNRPKWIIGYSDSTVFHSHLLKNTGVETLHGPMPFNFEKDAHSLSLLKSALLGEPLSYAIPPHSLNRNGIGRGLLAGGNLSLLYSLASTPSDMEFDDKILFLEDLDEYLYHVDRMMMQLKRAGKLAKLKGLVAGTFTEMKDNAVPFGKTAEQIIVDAVKEYNFPLCFGFPAGHGAKNYPLIMGTEVGLSVSPEGTKLAFSS